MAVSNESTQRQCGRMHTRPRFLLVGRVLGRKVLDLPPDPGSNQATGQNNGPAEMISTGERGKQLSHDFRRKNPGREKFGNEGSGSAMGLVWWKVRRVLREGGERRHWGSYYRCEILKRTNTRKQDHTLSLKLKWTNGILFQEISGKIQLAL